MQVLSIFPVVDGKIEVAWDRLDTVGAELCAATRARVRVLIAMSLAELGHAVTDAIAAGITTSDLRSYLADLEATCLERLEVG